MTTTHTPGPWTVDDTEYIDIVAPAGRIAMLDSDLLTDHCEANARLIAAAPDLLAALQEMLKYAEGFEDADHVIDARAAIARATGADA